MEGTVTTQFGLFAVSGVLSGSASCWASANLRGSPHAGLIRLLVSGEQSIVDLDTQDVRRGLFVGWEKPVLERKKEEIGKGWLLIPLVWFVVRGEKATGNDK